MQIDFQFFQFLFSNLTDLVVKKSRLKNHPVFGKVSESVPVDLNRLSESVPIDLNRLHRDPSYGQIAASIIESQISRDRSASIIESQISRDQPLIHDKLFNFQRNSVASPYEFRFEDCTDDEHEIRPVMVSTKDAACQTSVKGTLQPEPEFSPGSSPFPVFSWNLAKPQTLNLDAFCMQSDVAHVNNAQPHLNHEDEASSFTLAGMIAMTESSFQIVNKSQPSCAPGVEKVKLQLPQFTKLELPKFKYANNSRRQVSRIKQKQPEIPQHINRSCSETSLPKAMEPPDVTRSLSELSWPGAVQVGSSLSSSSLDAVVATRKNVHAKWKSYERASKMERARKYMQTAGPLTRSNLKEHDNFFESRRFSPSMSSDTLTKAFGPHGMSETSSVSEESVSHADSKLRRFLKAQHRFVIAKRRFLAAKKTVDLNSPTPPNTPASKESSQSVYPCTSDCGQSSHTEVVESTGARKKIKRSGSAPPSYGQLYGFPW